VSGQLHVPLTLPPEKELADSHIVTTENKLKELFKNEEEKKGHRQVQVSAA
jgi:hypothetical protein